MIVTVTLRGLSLKPIDGSAPGVRFRIKSLSYSDAVFVTVGQYAAGNFRPRRQKGKQRGAKVELAGCTAAQARQLEDWQGVVLCMRDSRGRKIFGLYTDLATAATGAPDRWAASFTFTETSYSEAV